MGITSNTIFDDVFRTMAEKMPQLMIPLINEVFHTSYSGDEKIEHYYNEHHTANGQIISDSCFGIRSKCYHIECQSTPDSFMVIRMVEYDFAIALDNAWKTSNNTYKLEFPKSCVLYLRHTASTPDALHLELMLADARSFLYSVPIIKVQEYTRDEIFQKNLLLLLPFYILRYEKELPKISKDNNRLNTLLAEYEDIRQKLETELTGEARSHLYVSLINLITTISDYILQSEEHIKKGISDIMGGKVLELESDRLIAKGELLKLIESVCKKLSKGKTYPQISEELEEDYPLIEKLCLIAENFAPEYNRDQIFEAYQRQE